jgi:hypothetical protein
MSLAIIRLTARKLLAAVAAEGNIRARLVLAFMGLVLCIGWTVIAVFTRRRSSVSPKPGHSPRPPEPRDLWDRQIDGVRRAPVSPFLWNDALFLYALLNYDRRGLAARLQDLMGMCDAINRDIPGAGDFNDGLNRLILAGLVQEVDTRYAVTDRARQLAARVRRKSGSVFDEVTALHRALGTDPAITVEGSTRPLVDRESHRAARMAYEEDSWKMAKKVLKG